jgi:hypothetical protein
MRWYDLVRTKTLQSRLAAYNPVAAFNPTRDYLRPIPQSQINLVTNGLSIHRIPVIDFFYRFFFSFKPGMSTILFPVLILRFPAYEIVCLLYFHLFIFYGLPVQCSIIQPKGADNIVYKWGKISLDATADNTDLFRPRPTVTSRMLALVWTSVYDAWSRFDATASPVYLINVERVSPEKRTIRNKEIAISYAAYRALMEYYTHDSAMLTNK